MWHTAKVKTLADVFKETAVLGGSGPNDSETYPLLMNNTIGTKFRIVSGYKSNNNALLAVERGEVEGVSGSWSSLKASRSQWLKDKQVNLIVQVGRTKHPDLRDVPLVYDYVKEAEHRTMWDVMIAIATLGRPLAAPPGVPAEQVAILRKAFAATMKDAEYLAEMEKSNRELTPTGGEDMQQMMQEVSAVPQATLVKLNSWIRRQYAFLTRSSAFLLSTRGISCRPISVSCGDVDCVSFLMPQERQKKPREEIPCRPSAK